MKNTQKLVWPAKMWQYSQTANPHTEKGNQKKIKSTSYESSHSVLETENKARKGSWKSMNDGMDAVAG